MAVVEIVSLRRLVYSRDQLVYKVWPRHLLPSLRRNQEGLQAPGGFKLYLSVSFWVSEVVVTSGPPGSRSAKMLGILTVSCMKLLV